MNGTWGSAKNGSAEGSSPMSPTVASGLPLTTVNRVSATIATSGAGTADVRRGSR